MDTFTEVKLVSCLFPLIDGQSRLCPHALRQQPRHRHVFLLPQRAGGLGARRRPTVGVTQDSCSCTSVYDSLKTVKNWRAGCVCVFKRIIFEPPAPPSILLDDSDFGTNFNSLIEAVLTRAATIGRIIDD